MAARETDRPLSEDEVACRALTRIPNLTILSAEVVAATDSTPAYCYVRGLISPAIHYHVQLPLPSNWNGRFLKWGDGGKDGDLDFADHRVAQGYAVANSNSGHDSGSEPGASFAFNNRQAEIDYGYRAVHLTSNAAKTVIKTYYGREAQYSYLEGCSNGGREGLMEAQRFPYDFDGIVAGAPVLHYQALNASNLWTLQRMFVENFAGNLAFDTQGDGSYASLTKLNLLREAVLAKCDARDGIRDGVIDDPLSCDFDPVV
ncbi:MAG: tannase/feruloyl esterase family alpha/beta hydrolase, partial [Acidobacteria bacterium]|nr:tannase/feruloyl esterase family alpha/beta hydrolase [Acidobacteriota bacterium]